MRILFSSVVAAGLLLNCAAQAEICTRPADKAAFDVAGLKSQLMVTAISCKAEERYNSFVVRFRPDLVRQESALNSYFQRSFGHRASQEHDDYITSLANAQSMTGIHAGTAFCAQNMGLFDEVMALKTGAELPALAAAHTLTQPIVLEECAAPAMAQVRTASATAIVRKHN